MVEDIEKLGYVVFDNGDFEQVLNFCVDFENVMMLIGKVVVYINFENFIGNL